jgi:hypothetical protein
MPRAAAPAVEIMLMEAADIAAAMPAFGAVVAMLATPVALVLTLTFVLPFAPLGRARLGQRRQQQHGPDHSGDQRSHRPVPPRHPVPLYRIYAPGEIPDARMAKN